MAGIDDIIEDFELLEEWEDRYRYVIDMGKDLEPLPDALRTDATKVQGCVSQVWLHSKLTGDGPQRLVFQGDSDAHIVRGLIAVLFRLYSDKTPEEILAVDPMATLSQLDLDAHLSPQRSNGLHSMIKRVQHDARQAIEKRPGA